MSRIKLIMKTIRYHLSVRLVNGNSPYEGRVEIQYNGEWGTVCDDLFDDTDAQVVCSQLGFSGGQALVDCEFGEGDGTIWIDSLECYGSESEIGVCQHDCWGCEDCSHYEDAGVICRKHLHLQYGNHIVMIV